MHQSRQGVHQAIEPLVAPVPDLAPSVLFKAVHHPYRAGFGRELLDHVLIKAADWRPARTAGDVNESRTRLLTNRQIANVSGIS